MLEISKKTNLLEQKSYKYSLQDVEEPNLYRDVYSYTEVPKVPFNHRRYPMNMPENIWITDIDDEGWNSSLSSLIPSEQIGRVV